MTNSDDSDDRPTQAAAPTVRASTRRLRWWVAGITFVVGFVFGILAVGLLNLATPEFGAEAQTSASASPTQVPGPVNTNPVVAEARVNAACLAVINGAQDMYSILTGVGQAVKDVDLQQLDDIVRRLQPVEARLGQDLQNCRVDTDVVPPTASAPPSEPTASAPPSEPTASPPPTVPSTVPPTPSATSTVPPTPSATR